MLKLAGNATCNRTSPFLRSPDHLTDYNRLSSYYIRLSRLPWATIDIIAAGMVSGTGYLFHCKTRVIFLPVTGSMSRKVSSMPSCSGQGGSPSMPSRKEGSAPQKNGSDSRSGGPQACAAQRQIYWTICIIFKIMAGTTLLSLLSNATLFKIQLVE